LAKDIVSERKFVYPNVDLNQIIKIFSQYNLRILPVVDKEKRPIGTITVDTVLSKIEERIRGNEAI
ncbi:MAG: CBS domain-containing protein, partial [Patescibacteria group bacterium]|nr:CBS domain-containing protein [Patescibacteria group bacterium]